MKGGRGCRLRRLAKKDELPLAGMCLDRLRSPAHADLTLNPAATTPQGPPNGTLCAPWYLLPVPLPACSPASLFTPPPPHPARPTVASTKISSLQKVRSRVPVSWLEPMKRSVRGLWKLGRHRSCGMVPGAGGWVNGGGHGQVMRGKGSHQGLAAGAGCSCGRRSTQQPCAQPCV